MGDLVRKVHKMLTMMIRVVFLQKNPIDFHDFQVSFRVFKLAFWFSLSLHGLHGFHNFHGCILPQRSNPGSPLSERYRAL